MAKQIPQIINWAMIKGVIDTSVAAGYLPARLIKLNAIEFERKRGMDSYFKENNWTGSTGSLG
jgi:hypothetical protein